jgi:allantoin racemase
LEDLAKKYGLFHKLASVRKISASPLDFASQKSGLLERLLTVGRQAIEEDGADSLIGYGGIEGIEHLRRELGVPVISPVQASVLMAEALVRSNLSHSKLAYPTPSDLNQIKELQIKYE